MVVPIGELTNKHFSTNTFNSISVQIAKALAYEAIDIDSNNDIRRRTAFPSNLSSRSYSVSSMASSVSYYKRMDINNNLLDEKTTKFINSSQLSYCHIQVHLSEKYISTVILLS